MSSTRKMRARLRLKSVDDVVTTLHHSGVQCSALVSSTSPPALAHIVQTKALAMPTQRDMPPKDKYTIFSRTDPGYRKSLHKVRTPFSSLYRPHDVHTGP